MVCFFRVIWGFSNIANLSALRYGDIRQLLFRHGILTIQNLCEIENTQKAFGHRLGDLTELGFLVQSVVVRNAKYSVIFIEPDELFNSNCYRRSRLRCCGLVCSPKENFYSIELHWTEIACVIPTLVNTSAPSSYFFIDCFVNHLIRLNGTKIRR